MPRRPAAAPLTSLALVLAGGATGTTALWREGIPRAGLDGPAPVTSRSPGEVTVHLKPELGLLEEVESRRSWMDGTTQVYRRAFLLEPEGEPPPPAGPLEVLGWVTSE